MFISLGMLSFAMNILISKEKRKIGIYLTYGYHNIEIFETYFTSILLLVFNAFISSVFNVIFVSLYETLMYEKTVYSFGSINPIVYITMALFSIFSLMIGALHIHSKIHYIYTLKYAIIHLLNASKQNKCQKNVSNYIFKI